MTFSRTRVVRFRLPALIATLLALSGAARAGEGELSVAAESAPESGRAWTTATLVGGGALLFASGFTDGHQDPRTNTPTFLGASLGVSGMGVAGLGYWWLLEEAGVSSSTGMLTGVAAFQLGWLGMYLLGNGAGLIASDGDGVCPGVGGGCAGVSDNRDAYTLSLLGGTGGVLAAGALTAVVVYGTDAGQTTSHSGNRRRFSLVPGLNGATLMGSF